MNCLTHVSPGKIFTNNFAIFFFFNIPPSYFFPNRAWAIKRTPPIKRDNHETENYFSTQGGGANYRGYAF